MGSAVITARDRGRLRDALGRAEYFRFCVEPNPMVGCVVYAGDVRVGVGAHACYGGPHAEIAALRDAGGRARGATAYVSLEPCTTTGKTGPCVEALAKAGVKRVVWAVADPNPAHRGKAAAALRAHGIVAEGPAFDVDPAPLLTRALRRSLRSDRPWVIAKWASSLDGRLARRRGGSERISNSGSVLAVHELRGSVEAVAVGVGTVRTDDPRLDCRLPGGPPNGRSQPAAVVFDSRLRTPTTSRLVRNASLARPLLLYVGRPAARRLRTFARLPGVVVVERPRRDGRVDLAASLGHLRSQGARRVLVEGGGTLLGALFGEGLVDQVLSIVAPVVVGDADAPSIVLPSAGLVGRTFARGESPTLECVDSMGIGARGRGLEVDSEREWDVWIQGYVRPRRVSARSRARS